MSGNQELCPAGGLKAMNNTEKAELALWRKCSFGFVKDVNSTVKAVCEKGQERLAVRQSMKRTTPVPCKVTLGLFEISRKTIKALRAHEESVSNLWQPGEVKSTC